MAFQDFDALTNRRQLHRRQKIKQRIIIVVTFIIVVLGVSAVVSVVMHKINRPEPKKDSAPSQNNQPKEDSTSPKNNPPKENPAPPKNNALKEDLVPPPKENLVPPKNNPPKEDSAPSKNNPPKEDLAPPLKEDLAPPKDNPPKEDLAPSKGNRPQEDLAPLKDKGSESPSAPKSDLLENEVKEEVKMACVDSDFKNICEERLFKELGKSKKPLPKEVLRAAIVAPSNEIKASMKKLSNIEHEGMSIKHDAIKDCLELLNDAMEDLNETLDGMDLDKREVSEADLNTWLSAALSNQQTCIEGFPVEKVKVEVENLLKDAKELSSNALAIVANIVSNVSDRKLEAKSQRKLGSLDLVEFPEWINHDRRKFLVEDDSKSEPNVTVAKDGSGKFDSISIALKEIPKASIGRYVIYVKEGIYEENIVVNKKMMNITIYGDGPDKTIVSGCKNFADGVTVYRSATFEGKGFHAKAIGFRNTAGPQKNQAVALKVQADHSIFFNCVIEGHQNTLFAQSLRQFYRSCDIFGTVDIIFGDASAVFQNCRILVRKPLKNQNITITAQSRIDRREDTGIVIQNSYILADSDLQQKNRKFRSYLGRSGKEYARTVVMQTHIGDLIETEGWVAVAGQGVENVTFAEYNNKGIGGKTSGRVKWGGYKVIGKEDAGNFTVGKFLQGETWIKGSRVPARFELYNK